MPSYLISKLIAIFIDNKKQLFKQGHNVCINGVVKLKNKKSKYLKI